MDKIKTNGIERIIVLECSVHKNNTLIESVPLFTSRFDPPILEAENIFNMLNQCKTINDLLVTMVRLRVKIPRSLQSETKHTLTMKDVTFAFHEIPCIIHAYTRGPLIER